jgi:hypothetical protein
MNYPYVHMTDSIDQWSGLVKFVVQQNFGQFWQTDGSSRKTQLHAAS